MGGLIVIVAKMHSVIIPIALYYYPIDTVAIAAKFLLLSLLLLLLLLLLRPMT